VIGKISGGTYKTKLPNGVIFTIQGTPIVSGASCSVRDGNPFAE
jgi:hypothetical protein